VRGRPGAISGGVSSCGPLAVARAVTQDPGKGGEESLTTLLRRASAADRGAEDELLARVYDELRRIARRQLRGSPGATGPATALAHEVYMELVRENPGDWPSRRYFFAAFTRALHNRLVDRLRRRAARGRPMPLPAELAAVTLDDQELIALREHLEQLDRVDARAAEVFRVHFLAGLTIPEIAAALELGHATVERDLLFARTWLHSRMRPL